MSKIKDLFASLRVGAPVQIANNGKPIDEVVIRYKDFFFMIDIDAETGEPTGDFGWSQGDPMTHIPVRDFWVAFPPEVTGQLAQDSEASNV